MFDFLKRFKKKKVTSIVMVSGNNSVNICADGDVVVTEESLAALTKGKLDGDTRSMVYCERVEQEERR